MLRGTLLILMVLLLLSGCRPLADDGPELPTLAPAAEQPTEIAVVAETTEPTATIWVPSPTWTNMPGDIPPTWTHTPVGPTALPTTYATATRRPTFTPWPTSLPTNTAVPIPATLAPTVTTGPTATLPPTSVPTLPPTAIPSGTPLPTNTPVPQPTATLPPAAGNILPNPGFEGGWYHINGIPELQIPAEWRFVWEEGDNPLDPDPWNKWVRPEVRVLTTDFLPAHEHPIFIWDGTQTVKIFKGTGAISFRLETDMLLAPGRYRLTINVFPDLVVGYEPNGDKIWAPDPLSGEIRLIAGGQGTGWLLPIFGQRNTLTHEFVLTQQQSVTVGAAMRGRWAILNNGWFMDHWSLVRVGDA